MYFAKCFVDYAIGKSQTDIGTIYIPTLV